MFGRKQPSEGPIQESPHPTRDGAKNRPTPKRRDQEAARRQPLVGGDRKEAKSADRAARREAFRLRQQAMITGDERHYPPRDQGPRRKLIRDWVDSRWNVGEFMLPVMLVVLALSFFKQSTLYFLIFVLVYGLVAVAVVDSWWSWRGLKKVLVERFGGPERGDVMYAVTRAFQMRRTRMPRPQVKRGEKPA